MSEEQWTWQCDHVIPNDAGAGRRILDELLRELEADHWIQHDIYSVRLAVEEALVNAIIHGNQLDSNKRVRISCRVAPELVRVEITDEGEGFNPAAVPDPTDPKRLELPGGRGVMLMRAFMSQVKYNAPGNCVVLEKERERAK